MPLEIRELQINISVDTGAKSGQQAASAPSDGDNSNEELVSECVEQVINTLHQQKER